MSQDRIEALRTELAYCEQTGNPRAEQVRAALAAAGAPVEQSERTTSEGAAPKRRGPGRPRKENTADKTPKETA